MDEAIDRVGNDAFGMQTLPKRISFHAQADEVIGSKELESLVAGDCHE
jgi:hypothetical protein